MKTLKVTAKLLTVMLFFGIAISSCSKTDDPIGTSASSEKLSWADIGEFMTDSVFVQDTMQRTFTIYDACGNSIGTITTNS